MFTLIIVNFGLILIFSFQSKALEVNYLQLRVSEFKKQFCQSKTRSVFYSNRDLID